MRDMRIKFCPHSILIFKSKLSGEKGDKKNKVKEVIDYTIEKKGRQIDGK